MNKKISVVIPVYNVEPDYIDTAIKSVLNQTYKNIEIIVVNDGSSDEKTLAYIDTIDNPEIKVINQLNKGLGGARNTGIDNSTGDYIGFLDSDDWLDSNFYETLYKLCEENDADIACGILTRTSLDSQTPIDRFENTIITDLAEKMKYVTNGSVCSKIFRAELFDNIRFREVIYYEDNPILVELLAKSNKVAYTNAVKYYYRENPKSICLNPKNEEKRVSDGFKILNDIYNIVKNRAGNEKFAVLKTFVPMFVNVNKFKTDKQYKKCVKKELIFDCKKYFLKSRNTFIEDIFSIKNSYNKTHKVVTILGIKIKIKRKAKNHA